MNRNFKFKCDLPNIKAWRFFEQFYIIPTLGTFATNTYYWGKDYYYTRYIELYWLWFSIGVSWDFGKVKEQDK